MNSILAAQGRTRVAATSDVPEGTAAAVRVADQPVCVVRTRDRWHAVLDECTHGEVPLSEGDVEKGTIECWMHGCRFDLSTGEPLTSPVPVFRVVGDDVYVCVAPTDPEMNR